MLKSQGKSQVKSQVRSFIAERKLEGRVNVHHFHEWCGEQLRTYHVEVPHDGGQIWDRQVEAVMIVPETGGASGPGPAFRQFETIGDEIAYAVKCLKAWHERGDFLGDIAVICMKPDLGKRIAHQLQALGIPHHLKRHVYDRRISPSPAGGLALPLLTDHFSLGTSSQHPLRPKQQRP